MSRKPSVSEKVETNTVIDLLEQYTDGHYKQFKQTEKKSFISLECPSCNREFGLPSDFIDTIGEASYLYPYFCPYCGKSYTIKR